LAASSIPGSFRQLATAVLPVYFFPRNRWKVHNKCNLKLVAYPGNIFSRVQEKTVSKNFLELPTSFLGTVCTLVLTCSQFAPCSSYSFLAHVSNQFAQADFNLACYSSCGLRATDFRDQTRIFKPDSIFFLQGNVLRSFGTLGCELLVRSALSQHEPDVFLGSKKRHSGAR